MVLLVLSSAFYPINSLKSILMAYKLSPKMIDFINDTLPPQFAALMSRYPSTIFNAANHYDKPKFPQGYVPKRIAIYYQESAPTASILWMNGQLDKVEIEQIPVDPDVIQVMIEGTWGYIQVQGKVILDRTEGVQFPPELTQHELMLRKLIHSISSGNYRDLNQ